MLKYVNLATRAACLLAVTIGLGAALQQPVLAQNTKLPIESFFQNPSVGEAALSPDGKYLAMLVAIPNGRVQLAAVEIGSDKPVVIAGFTDTDIGSFAWVSNQRLVFDTADLQTAAGDIRLGRGLFAINRDGSEPRPLVTRSGSPFSTIKILSSNHSFHSVDPINLPDQVYVVEYAKIKPYSPRHLMLLNTRTGEFETVGRAAPHPVSWVIAKDGVPRIMTTQDKGTTTIYYNDPVRKEWRQIAEFEYLSPEAFTPTAFGSDGTLYVSSAIAGDKKALHSFDLVNNRINPQPLVSMQNYDLIGGFIPGPNGNVGVRYLAKTWGTHWFDPAWKKVQQDVDALLPFTTNILYLARDQKSPHVVVWSNSDLQPAIYSLYNTETHKLSLMGKSMPAIDPNKMAETVLLRYPARDGLEIPAWLTLPPNGSGKNLPLVVLVHGGPYVRGGSWGWRPDRQFLASRGYAVLEPEFRGSTGFGSKHYRAGWKQWGLSMQDDIADGARTLINKGIADPKRICIAGASYGGYATLMGLINDPDLFRCGVEWLGVADITMLYTVAQSDMTDEAREYVLPKLIADRAEDTEQLKRTSPIEQATRITQPLLMAYGEADKRVPIIHGTTLRDTLKKHNQKVEWISYPKEGHGWQLVSTRIDFWSRVEAFLDRNIGTAAASAPAKSQ